MASFFFFLDRDVAKTGVKKFRPANPPEFSFFSAGRSLRGNTPGALPQVRPRDLLVHRADALHVALFQHVSLEINPRHLRATLCLVFLLTGLQFTGLGLYGSYLPPSSFPSPSFFLGGKKFSNPVSKIVRRDPNAKSPYLLHLFYPWIPPNPKP